MPDHTLTPAEPPVPKRRGRPPKYATQGADGKPAGNGAPLGFETQLWATADALRNNMDAGEYKHVVLGLIFLKYISDAFEAKHADRDVAG